MLRRLLLLVCVLAASVAAMASPVGAGSAVSDCALRSSWGVINPAFEQKVVQLTNAYRTKKGLRPLKISFSLRKAARWKSLNMSRYNYFEHADAPTGRSVGQRLSACGYPATTAGWGENIAWGFGSPEAVVQGWITSPGHRANLETGWFRTTGIGVAQAADGRVYWTQEFGDR